jgi:hypothetical protein
MCNTFYDVLSFCPFHFDANTVHAHIVKSLGTLYSVPLQNYVKFEGVFRTVMKKIIQYTIRSWNSCQMSKGVIHTNYHQLIIYNKGIIQYMKGNLTPAFQ